MSTKLFRNISYLGLSQIANYLFPLITIPYITRVVGPENFGYIELAAAVMLYLVVLVDYSFNTTATGRIAVLKEEGKPIAPLFSAVMAAKALLLLLAAALLLLITSAVDSLRAQQALLWLAFPLVVGWILYPNFLLYGVQKLGVVALANFLIKGLAAGFIFWLINQPDHYRWVPFINGISQVGVGGAALLYVLYYLPGIRFIRVSWAAVGSVLREGRQIFVSNLLARVYSLSALVMGGLVLPPLQLGIFAAASKLITVGQSFLFQPLHGALFPFFSALHQRDAQQYRRRHSRGLWLLAGATLAASLGLYFFAPWLVPLIFGEGFQATIPLLQTMAPMLFVGSFAHMHLQQGLLIVKKYRSYLWVIFWASLWSVLGGWWLINQFGAAGAAQTRLITESLLALLATGFFYKYRPA